MTIKTKQDILARRPITSANREAISKIKDDIRVTTLERYVRALGGRLEVRAVFDDEAVNLTDETGEAT